MMKIIYILFLFTLLSSTHASVNDFCVADTKAPETPTGYPCKPVSSITSDDFVYHGLVAGNTNSSSKIAVTAAHVTEFRALNGLGISVARLDLAEGGTVPMHTHPGANELVIVLEGELTAGFVTPTSAYSKTLKSGDLIVFPQGNLHFLTNSGKGKASAFFTFSSENPSTHLLDNLLFSNNLPSKLIARTTLLDLAQVKKLKAQFGGRG